MSCVCAGSAPAIAGSERVCGYWITDAVSELGAELCADAITDAGTERGAHICAHACADTVGYSCPDAGTDAVADASLCRWEVS